MKLLKMFIAVLALPLAAGLCVAFFRIFSGYRGITSSEIWFIFGFLLFALIYVTGVLPGYVYVFGHESTHALWAILFRGRIKSFKVSSNSGNVVTDKANFFVVLAPYFFPFYTAAAVILYYVLAFFTDAARFVAVLYLVVGLTYSFHLFLTFEAMADDQPDIKKSGYVFSYVVIACLNLVILAVVFKFIAPEKISVGKYLMSGAKNAFAIYKYFWHHLTELYYLL
jgi:hypothetical protein